MTAQELAQSALSDATPPPNLTPPLTALWHCKKGEWEASHNIAQDIHTPTGSWIHALLHLIEGDTGNANYWFARANRPPRSIPEIDALWEELANKLLSKANL